MNTKKEKALNSYNTLGEIKIAKTNAIMSVLTKFSLGKSLANAPQIQIVFIFGENINKNSNERKYDWFPSGYYFIDRFEIYNLLVGLNKVKNTLANTKDIDPQKIAEFNKLELAKYNNPLKKKTLSITPNIYFDKKINNYVKNVSIKYSMSEPKKFTNISIDLSTLQCIIDEIKSIYDNLPLLKTQIMNTPQYQNMVDYKMKQKYPNNTNNYKVPQLDEEEMEDIDTTYNIDDDFDNDGVVFENNANINNKQTSNTIKFADDDIDSVSTTTVPAWDDNSLDPF